MKKIVAILLFALAVFVPVSSQAQTATLPAGCTSTAGFSSATGVKCDSSMNNTSVRGCLPGYNFSPITGEKCDVQVNVDFLPAGCASTEGYSLTTGARCDALLNGGNVLGCTTNIGYSPTTGVLCSRYVVGVTTLSQLSVSSPSAGDIWVQNNSYTVRWTPVTEAQQYMAYLGNRLAPEDFSGAPFYYPVSGGASSITFDQRDLSQNLVSAVLSNARQNNPNVTEAEVRRNFFVRVEAFDSDDVNNQRIVARGDSGVFSIIATQETQTSIRVISPNGGEVFRQGNSYRISWSSTGLNNPNYSVRVENTNGTCFAIECVIANSIGNRTYIDWIVPSDALDGNYKVNVSSGNYYDLSDNSFTITSGQTNVPSISVVSPNGGETLVKDQNHTIRWRSENLPSGAEIGISIFRYPGEANAPVTINNLPSTQNQYIWKVTDEGSWGLGMKEKKSFLAKMFGPEVANAAVPYGYKILVSANWGRYVTGDPNDPYGNAYDYSNNTFAIISSPTPFLPPNISITSPTGGETWYEDRVYVIRWSGNTNRDSLDLFLWNGRNSGGYSSKTIGQAITRIPNAAASGEYRYTLKRANVWNQLLPNGNDYTIRIHRSNQSDYVETKQFTVKNNDPELVASPRIDVQAPLGGETLYPGAVVDIKWSRNFTTTNVVHLVLESSVSGIHHSLSSIVTSLPGNSTSYRWTVPTNLPEGQYRVKVIQCDHNNTAFNCEGTTKSYFNVILNSGQSATAPKNNSFVASVIQALGSLFSR